MLLGISLQTRVLFHYCSCVRIFSDFFLRQPSPSARHTESGRHTTLKTTFTIRSPHHS